MTNTGPHAEGRSGPCCRLTGMRVTAIISATLLGVLLAGCTQQQAPDAGPSSNPSVQPSASETAAAGDEAFTLPTACVDILPASRLAEFEAAGDVLLGGPGGIYGDEYLLDPSPEQRAGGITCIWGSPETEISSVTVSVAPLADDTREAIVTDLSVTQGLNESVGETVTYYWKLGDRDDHPAILNALAPDSWISIIYTVGGIDSYTQAEKIAAEVHELVYR
jgi:hypothetical protein